LVSLSAAFPSKEKRVVLSIGLKTDASVVLENPKRDPVATSGAGVKDSSSSP